ncbi:MAG: glutamate ABC transporter substrate-binding protein [Actinomycetota bacterium]
MRATSKVLLALLMAMAMVAGACGDGGLEPEGDTEASPVEEADGSKPVPTFEAGTTMAALQQKGSIVVGTKFDQPLFGQKNPITEAIEGFDVEIAKIVAQGIFGGTLEEAVAKIQFVETVSRVREPNIQQGTVDFVVATYTINDTRKQIVDFAGPYYVAGQDIMVKSDDDSISGVQDLNGKKVCSVQGSTSISNVVAQAPQSDVSISFDTYSKCAEALTDGRVQAVTTDDTILVGLIKEEGQNFKLVDNPFTTEPYGIGLPLGDDAFRTFLNDLLERSYQDGSWAAAFERTVGTAGIATPEPPAVDRYQSASPAGPAATASPS